MNVPHTILSSARFPPGLEEPRPAPASGGQQSLFRVSLASALARLGVHPDDLRRWRANDWLSFDNRLEDEMDEFDDPRIWEIQIVRDIVRSGLTDAQIEVLFSKLEKPFAYNPDKLVYSFRYGWAAAIPPVEIPTPSDVIEAHLDEWIAERDEEDLWELRDKMDEALEALSKQGQAPNDRHT